MSRFTFGEIGDRICERQGYIPCGYHMFVLACETQNFEKQFPSQRGLLLTELKVIYLSYFDVNILSLSTASRMPELHQVGSTRFCGKWHCPTGHMKLYAISTAPFT